MISSAMPYVLWNLKPPRGHLSAVHADLLKLFRDAWDEDFHLKRENGTSGAV